MPRFNITLNLPGFTIKKTTGYDPMIHDVLYHKKPRCPHCKSKKLRKKDSFLRHIEHETVGFRRVLLRLRVNKYQCCCCKKYFRQRFEGILPWQRSTEPLKKQVYRLHTQGVSRKDLSQQLNKSDGTISRHYDYMYELQDRKRLSMRCPEILGIDEHYFSKKDGYATTFCDLKKHRIFDIHKGRYESDLKEYLQDLQGRERVRVVCMDLSSSYRSLVRKYFPNAKIVADRFHVVRLVLHRLIKTCQEVDPELKKQRGIARLLRKHKVNLTKNQAVKLQQYLEKHPQINAVYQFKEEMMKLLLHKKQTKKQCRKLIPQFLQAIEKLRIVGFEQCKKLAKTLQSWSEEIVRMWRFSKSNGITEGFHRKMKLIQRRAFGFKNFENYRKRVRVLCA